MKQSLPSMKKKRIAVITCYSSPDYVRASTLRQIFKKAYRGSEVIVIKNTRKGLLRYPEVFLKTMVTRLRYRPVAYILTFRGYEMLLPIRILTVGKPFIFDEFVNMEEWLMENDKLRKGALFLTFFSKIYSFCLSLSTIILSDTVSHARYSSLLSGIELRKYIPVFVGTDEEVFFPASKKLDNKSFEIFYYSTENQPLHGTNLVCNAAIELGRTMGSKIHFTLIGGGKELKNIVELATEKGANMTHISRVPYKEIASRAKSADLCLGGPFGDTLQASFVITGKTFQFLATGTATIIGINEETGTHPFVHKENCILVRRGSSKDIISAIRWGYDNKRKLVSIGTQGRKMFLEHYTIEALSKSLKSQLSATSIELQS